MKDGKEKLILYYEILIAALALVGSICSRIFLQIGQSQEKGQFFKSNLLDLNALMYFDKVLELPGWQDLHVWSGFSSPPESPEH